MTGEDIESKCSNNLIYFWPQKQLLISSDFLMQIYLYLFWSTHSYFKMCIKSINAKVIIAVNSILQVLKMVAYLFF